MKLKLKNQSGFTLAETLLAVLILLLVSVIVANGVPAATSAYEKIVIGANAKVLLSTTISALRDELATATNVSRPDITTITYYSADIGASSKIYLVKKVIEDDPEVIPTIMIQEYTDYDPTVFGTLTADKIISSVAARPLISDKAATGDLYVTYTSVAYTPGGESITINGLAVKRKADSDNVLASADLTIRFLVPTPTT